MSETSLEAALRSYDTPVERLREAGGRVTFPNVQREYTHWIEEQRACRETACLADLTHHQGDALVEGPDALDLLADHGVNRFADFEVGRAKQLVVCNPEGHFIGDNICQRLAEDRFLLSGPPTPVHWLQYHLETGGYDATIDYSPRSADTDDDPRYYTYQVQGPHALAVLQAVTDAELADVPFFHFTRVTIAGREVRALRHGMSGEVGFELQGPYAERGPVREALLEAGEAHDLRRLGTRAYQSLSVMLGWVTGVVPAIYGEATRDYRAWLPADGFEGRYAIAGSYEADDITDYYVTPAEIGYEHLVDLDGDFVGRDALERELADPDRTLVTLVWDDDAVVDLYASLFRDGTPGKFLELPRTRWGAHYDAVRRDGDVVGVSKSPAYSYLDRAVLSLCSLDRELAEPGTEVTLTWGQPDRWRNPLVERHAQTEIDATVAPVPFVDDRRKGDW